MLLVEERQNGEDRRHRVEHREDADLRHELRQLSDARIGLLQARPNAPQVREADEEEEHADGEVYDQRT